MLNLFYPRVRPATPEDAVERDRLQILLDQADHAADQAALTLARSERARKDLATELQEVRARLAKTETALAFYQTQGTGE